MRSRQLGDKIKIAMIENSDSEGRWTQKRICDLLEINYNVFSRFIRGTAGLPDEKITDIAKLLNASFEINTGGIHYLINPNGDRKY